MKNFIGKIIYVGKAKVLKNRVRQYFHSSANHGQKTRAMVEQIVSFEYIITDTETEALILECTLIKKHRPHYNILMKDDKSYPYIRVTTNDDFPRLEITRRLIKDGSRYYGAYSSMGSVRESVELINKIFPIRTCRRKIDPGKKARPCLNYHIGKCPGPCGGKITMNEYREIVAGVLAFLEGKQEDIIKEYEEKMHHYAEVLQFEKAAALRDKIQAIRLILQKQKVFSTSMEHRDVLAVAVNEVDACIQLLQIRNGRLIGKSRFFMEGAGQSAPGEILESFLKQFYSQCTDFPREILLEHDVEDIEAISEWLRLLNKKKVELIAPKRGDKKELIRMASLNARQELERYARELARDRLKVDEAIVKLSRVLNLSRIPQKIEAYDISNTGETEKVGSMIVFMEGKPDKSKYRRFKIKNVDLQNDYACMQEMLYRRLKRFRSHQENNDEQSFGFMPDLLLIDGGKGHVGVIKEVLKEMEMEDIPVWGMAKDDRHQSQRLVSSETEYYLENDMDLLRLITSIQDEAHRFALAYNRKLRDKRTQYSVLDDIDGIGPERKKKLIKHFGSVRRMKEAEIEDLEAVDGISRKVAEKIYEALH